MARLSATLDHDWAVLGLSGHDALAQWPAWMLEPLAPLMLDAAAGLGLFSFQSARPFATGPLADAATLASARGLLVVCEGLPAEAQLETALARAEPIDVTGAFYRGIVEQTRGEFAAALASFAAVLTAQPKLPRVRNVQGMCLRRLGRTDEAERAYCDEIDNDPQAPDAYCNLGVLYSKTGRQAMARVQFEKALDRDPFYTNVLVQLSRLVLDQEGPKAPLLAPLAWRLFTLYFDAVQVRQHLETLAAAAGVSLDQFRVQVETKAGPLRDPQVLALLRRVEMLRHNGCRLPALRAIAALLQATSTHPTVANFAVDWAARRLALLDERPAPEALREAQERVRAELLAAWPQLARGVAAPGAAPMPNAGALTPEEFFEVALEEVFGRGQLNREDMQLILRLKNLLRIDAATHQRLFNDAAARHAGNSMVDDGVEFDAERLFSRLVVAVARDGKLEPGERKLLDLACEALEVTPAVRDRLLAEHSVVRA